MSHCLRYKIKLSLGLKEIFHVLIDYSPADKEQVILQIKSVPIVF